MEAGEEGSTPVAPPASRNRGVHVTHRGTVAVLEMRSEATKNAFDPVYLREVSAALTRLLDDDTVRAVVLTGTGRTFSTGADVHAMAAAAQAGTASQWVLDATAVLHPLMLAMQMSPKPLLAAVNGVAAGGGLGLALACDARIGSPEARFAAGYFGLGLCPDGGATWLLPRLIGLQRTRRFFFDNEVMGAQEALRTGLLDAIEPEDVVATALAWAERWALWSRHSTGSTKRLLGTPSVDLATQLELERGLIAAAAARDDFKEGTLAFTSKRPPRFG